MHSKSLVYSLISLGCIALAGVLFVIAKPFATAEIYTQNVLFGQEATITQPVTETKQETTPVTVHNYDTEYGDKQVSAEDSKMCQDFASTVFNIGYRNIVNSRAAYTQSILDKFSSGSVDYSSYHFSPEQFADFMANMVEEQLLQIEGSLVTETSFEKDDVCYVNGTLTLTVHAGENLDQLNNFFNSDIKLNENRNIPVSFKISRTTGQLIGFSPAYTKVN